MAAPDACKFCDNQIDRKAERVLAYRSYCQGYKAAIQNRSIADVLRMSMAPMSVVDFRRGYADAKGAPHNYHEAIATEARRLGVVG